MKEYTVITTVEFTDIVKRISGDYEPIPKEEVKRRLESVIDADDINVTGIKVFERDVRLNLFSHGGN